MTAPIFPPSYIDRYVEHVGPAIEGRAVLRVDTVWEGELIETHVEGSPAPIETVRRHVSRITLAHRPGTMLETPNDGTWVICSDGVARKLEP